MRSRERAVKKWIAAGKLRPIERSVLFYMIWTTTQRYANVPHVIATLEKGALSDEAFDGAERQLAETILGV